MIKTKKKKIYLPLVVTGYSLFALLLFTTFISTTIPFSAILFQSGLTKVNVIFSMIALTIGTVLPVIVGYFVGDHAVKSKSRLEHHFNGILFGLLAYWIMTLASAFVQVPMDSLLQNSRMTLMSLLPSLAVAVITVALAIAHVRGRQAKHDVLSYKPFAATLIAGVVAMPLLVLIQNISTNSEPVYSFTPMAIILVPGLISFLSLHRGRLKPLERLSWTAVSVSVLYVMMAIFYMVIPSIYSYLVPYSTVEQQTNSNAIATVFTIIAWTSYWLIQLKTLRNHKR